MVGSNDRLSQDKKFEDARQRIFSALVSIMENQGYDGVTVRNICKTAGLSIGTFYHYFTSRDDLMARYLMDAFEKFVAANRTAQALATDTFIDKIIDRWHWYTKFCMGMGLKFLTNYYTANNYALARQKSWDDDLVGCHFSLEMQKYLYEAQDQDLITPEADVLLMSENLCAIVNGNIFEWCLGHGAFNLTENTCQMVQIYLDYFLTDKGRVLVGKNKQYSW